MVRDTESFIKKAREIYGDKYDYSLVDYKNTKEVVKIICPLHGVFEKKPINFLQGYDCKEGLCAQRRGGLIDGRRRCAACGEYLELSEFGPNHKMKDGLNSTCKKCCKIASDKWKANNIEKFKESCRRRDKLRWDKYKEEHKDEFEQRATEREQQHEKCVFYDKLKRTLKSRLRDALINDAERPHIKELLGCSLQEFKVYIEGLWTEGMTWENRSYYGWHLDHIIPCASFDLTKPEEVAKCFHYTNYQPLWRRPNQTKQAKYNGVDYAKRKI